LSITISEVSNGQNFGTWLTRTNQLTDIISSNVVTTDASASGSLTTGNAHVNGYFGATLVAVGNSIQGGTINASANLYVTSNTFFSQGLTPLGGIYGNTSVGSTFNISTNNLIINNFTTIVGNTNFANSMVVNSSINATAGIYASNTFVANATLIGFGNSTVNATLNATSLAIGPNTVANTTVFKVLDAGSSAIINTTALTLGVNVMINTSSVSLGNSTVNTIINSTTYVSGNTTVYTTRNSTTDIFVSPLSNTSVNSTGVAVGANLVINPTTITFGNSTVNTTVNSSFYSSTANNALTALISNNSINFGGNPVAFYANISSPVHTASVAVGANVVANTTTILIGNTTVNTVINSSSIATISITSNTITSNTISSNTITTNIINGANLVITGNGIVTGSLTVSGNLIYSGTTTSTGNNNPTLDNFYYLGNTTNRWIGVLSSLTANSASIGNSTVNTVINSSSISSNTIITNTINASGNVSILGQVTGNSGFIVTNYDQNGANFRIIAGSYGTILRNDGTNMSFLQTVSANAIGTWNAFRPLSWALGTGAVTIDGTGVGVSFGGSLSLPNTAAITIGNSTVFTTVNTTNFTGTANNSLYLGGTAAASYQLNSTLAANVATMASNNASFLGGVAPASYQLTGATLIANVATMTANNTSFVGATSASNVVSNAQLVANLTAYQTVSGMAAAVLPLTANNTLFVGTTSAANVVSNAQLVANLSNYQTTAGLAANVLVLTSNNSNYLGGAASAAYQTVAGLAANVAMLPSNNALYLGGTVAASYQLNSTLGANVATMTSNNSTNFGGHAVAFYANATNFNGAFNGSTINASSTANIVGTITGGAGIISSAYDANGANIRMIGGTYGVIERVDSTSYYVLLSNTADTYGSWNTLRPLTITLATGAVSIDGTGVGTTFGGNVALGGGSLNVGGNMNLTGNGFVNGHIQSLTMTTTTVSANYAVSNTDMGTVLVVNSSNNVYINLPNTLPTNAKLLITRVNTGNVNISNAVGLSLGSRTNNYNILNQYGSISLFVINSSWVVVDGNI